ncbi:MAG: pentapeptide repeat-containing protein [Waterburya sp.]
MNFELLTATTLFLTIGTAIPAFSYSEQDLSLLKRNRQCLDCNLSNLLMTSGDHSLYGQDLRNTNLQGANLSGSWLQKSDFRNANLSRINAKSVLFNGADLRNANLSYADVSGADFCKADLRGINWTGIIYDKETKCLPDEAINYVPTANNPAPSTDNNQPHHCQTNSVVSEPVVPTTSIAPVAPENPVSIQDTVNDVRQNVNTVRDLLNIFR